MTILNCRPIKYSIIVMLILLVTLPIVLPHNAVAAQDQSGQYYEKTFAWNYGGNHWTWNLSIPKALYEAYRAVPDNTRTRNGPEGYGFLTTTKDYYIQILAQKLNQTTNDLNYNSFDKISFVLAFVQSLLYTSDNVTTGYDEYPRFPIETLVDNGGDCEDTAILFASLTLILGYGTVYINPPNHYAVGILGNNIDGSYFTYQNRTYYYCETTGNGFKIGQLPDEFKNQPATIYPINENSQYVPNVQIQIADPTPTSASDTFGPTPTFDASQSPSPTIPQPTVQPVTPLTQAIADNPALFIIIILAIVVSIVVAVKSVQKPKSQPYTNQTDLQPAPASLVGSVEGNKFCIYCGSLNQQNAVYCQKCGKQIG